MHKISMSAVRQWTNLASRVWAPQSADIGCPYCKHTPVSFTFGGWEHRNDSATGVARCPRCTAEIRIWVLNHIQNSLDEFQERGRIYMDPAPPTDLDYHPKLATISPEFVRIVEQAERASQLDLDGLVGIGYRKALEFLIKDWLITLNPNDAEKIKKMALRACILDLVEDPNIKATANRTAHLGNDETHYIRKFTDKDVQDMRFLLRLTLFWLRMNIETQEAIEDMPLPEDTPKSTT